MKRYRHVATGEEVRAERWERGRVVPGLMENVHRIFGSGSERRARLAAGERATWSFVFGKDGPIECNPGDWLVAHAAGYMSVFADDAFRAEFSEAQ